MCEKCMPKEIDPSLKDSLAQEQDNAQRGLLVKVQCQLKNIFRMDNYAFLEEKEADTCPDTVHENLWEQAKLNMNYGLYRVYPTPGEVEEQPEDHEKIKVAKGDVFQIRGFDLANMTLVYNGHGWVVMDVLTTSETAREAWDKVVKVYLNDDKIDMVLYSHSHIDHYGGIGGLKDYLNEGHQVIAPKGFTENAVSENIYAGTAMKRRAMYQYGSNLNVGVKGQVDCGLGKAVANGKNTILKPTQEIGFEDYDENRKYYTVPGTDLKMQIQLTPGTEAPAEMNIYMPEHKVLFIAENCAGTLHNALTPRGAQVRDLLAWANFLDQTLVTFPDIETVCSAHNWPHFGADQSRSFIEVQRDMYRYINNATLHLINQGYTIDEVGRILSGEDGTVPVPGAFKNEWCCHGFYGTFNHNAKAVYQRYIGWYDGNPAHLNRHKPTERANRYVSAFGAENICEKARKALNRGDYAWAVELYDYLFNATYVLEDTVLQAARPDYAEALKQLGYQSEASTWRNMYLSAAAEIDPHDNDQPAADVSANVLTFPPTTIRAMSLEMILQYLGIMLDSKKVEQEHFQLEMNVEVTNEEIREKAFVRVDRGILHYRIDDLDKGQVTETEGTIRVEAGQLIFFKAFVDNDSKAIKKLTIESIGKSDKDSNPDNEKARETIKTFIEEYLTRFPISFPIMTPRLKCK